MVIIKSRTAAAAVVPVIPAYEVLTGYALISMDQDDTYLYAGTNAYLSPPVLVRFLKSTGAIAGFVSMSVGNAGSGIFDIKNDDDFVYCSVLGVLHRIEKIRKSDLSVVASITSAVFASSGVGVNSGQMWKDSAARQLRGAERVDVLHA